MDDKITFTCGNQFTGTHQYRFCFRIPDTLFCIISIKTRSRVISVCGLIAAIVLLTGSVLANIEIFNIHALLFFDFIQEPISDIRLGAFQYYRQNID